MGNIEIKSFAQHNYVSDKVFIYYIYKQLLRK
jgi:hypothetical protein